MWPFSRKPKVNNQILGRGYVLTPDEPQLVPQEHELGPFRIMHRKGRLVPAQNTAATEYAYDTLGLVPMFPINHIFAVQTPMKAAQPDQQLYVNQGALIYELPQPNGQIFSQPLYDPNAIPDNSGND